MGHSTMRVTKGALVVTVVVCGLASCVPGVRGQVPRAHPDLQQFFAASGTDDDPADDAIDAIAAAWRDGYDIYFLGCRPARRRRCGGLIFGLLDDLENLSSDLGKDAVFSTLKILRDRFAISGHHLGLA